MARKPFRLASLLRLRSQAEENAKRELGEATSAEQQAEQELRQQFAALTNSVMPHKTSNVKFQATMLARISARSNFEEARVLLAQRREQTEQAKDRWRDAHKKHEGVQRLQDKHEQQEKKHQHKQEQAVLDDVTSAKFAAKSRDEKK